MKNIAKIRVGVLGGRGYGKTVLLAKLINLAVSNKDGFIQFDAGAEALQILNKILMNGGTIDSTEIGKIKKYDFQLGNLNGSKWKIRFCDYAGELLERIDTGSEATSKSQEDISEDDMIATSGNRPYIKKVKRWLCSCDAFVVLVPANISEYKRDEVEVFKQNIGLMVQVINDSQILKNRPICMAINKWDWFDGEVSFDEIIQQEPFVSFKQLLHNHCDKSLFCMPISAFGKHLANDKEKAAPDGKPYRVLEMLVALSRRAEIARFASIKNIIGHGNRLLRWLYAPALLLHNHICRGITNQHMLQASRLLIKKHATVFLRNSLILAIFLIFSYSVATTALFKVHYDRLKKEIASENLNRTDFERIETNLKEKRWCNFIFDNVHVFKVDRATLNTVLQEKKAAFNKNISEDVMAYIESRQDVNDLNVDPSVRKAKVEEIQAKIKDALKLLTACAEERPQLEKKLEFHEELASGIRGNAPFDAEYQKWLSLSSDIDKLNLAHSFLSQFTNARYPERKTHIQNVQSEKTRLEDSRYNQLKSSLQREKYADDFNEKTNNYLQRIARAQERIGEIKQEMQKTPNSRRMTEYKQLLQEENDRIAYLDMFGEFDEQAAQLQTSSGVKVIKQIEIFLHDNENKYSKQRAGTFSALHAKINELDTTAYSQLDKNLTSESVTDSPELAWDIRVGRATRRKQMVNNTLKELSVSSQYRSLLLKYLRSLDELILERNHYGPFEVAFAKVRDSENNGKIKRILEFIDEYPPSKYLNKKECYAELEDLQQRLSSSFYDELQRKLSYPDSKAKWRIRKAAAIARIETIRATQKELDAGSEEYRQCAQLTEKNESEIKDLEYYGKFDDAHDELLSQDKDALYIRKLEKFLKDWDEKTYPERKDTIKRLNEELANREERLYLSLTENANNKESWREQNITLQKQIDAITRGVKNFSNDSRYRTSLQKKQGEINEVIKSNEKYGLFDDAAKTLAGKLGVATASEKIALIERFLSTEPWSDEKSYDARKTKYSELRGEIKNADATLYRELMSLLQGDDVKKQDHLFWTTQRARSLKRIELLSNYKELFSKNAGFRTEIANLEKGESEFVRKIDSYKTYYLAYGEVENKSDVYQIHAIDTFKAKFKGQYPNPLPRYSMDNLDSLQKDLMKRFFDELTNTLKQNSDEPNDSWEIKLGKAKTRKEAYERYQTVISNADCHADDIKNEQKQVDFCVSNIKFEKAVKTILDSQAGNHDKLKAIYDFYRDFPASQWKKAHENEYISIEACEKEVVAKIEATIGSEISKTTAPKNASVAQRVNSLAKRLEIWNRYIKDYPENTRYYSNLYNEVTAQELDLANLKRIQTIQSQILSLCREGEKLSLDKPFDIGVFLSSTSQFAEDYPRDKIPDMIIGDYNRLVDLRSKWNNQLITQLNTEIKPYEDSLLNDDLNDEEKDKLRKRILASRNKYLTYLSPESDQFKQLQRQYIAGEQAQAKREEEKKLAAAIADLLRELESNRFDTKTKLEKIDLFEANFGDKKTEFVLYRRQFDEIKNRKARLIHEAEWNDVSTQIAKSLRDHLPSADDEEKIAAFIQKCDDFQRETKKYIDVPLLAERAVAMQSRLTKTLNDYLPIRREWILFNALKKASNEYRGAPNAGTYKTFTNALGELNAHSYKNNKHLEVASELEKGNATFESARTDTEEKYAIFMRRKTPDALDNFIRSAEAYIKLGGDNRETRFARNILNWNKRVDVTLDGYDFRDGGFKSSAWAVDFHAEIRGLGPEIIYKAYGVKGEGRNNPSQYRIKEYLESKTSITRQGFASLQNKITIFFANYSGRNSEGKAQIDFSAIIAEGANTGSARIKFTSKITNREIAGDGSVYILFSGLPRY